jgi:hypothetical protein
LLSLPVVKEPAYSSKDDYYNDDSNDPSRETTACIHIAISTSTVFGRAVGISLAMLSIALHPFHWGTLHALSISTVFSGTISVCFAHIAIAERTNSIGTRCAYKERTSTRCTVIVYHAGSSTAETSLVIIGAHVALAIETCVRCAVAIVHTGVLVTVLAYY